MRESSDELYRLRDQHQKIEAVLCAVLTKLEKDDLYLSVLKDVDWKEAGVSATFVDKWWLRHKLEDEKRRLREAKEAERNREKEERRKQKEAVLAKLTPEERKLLGV
jgi:hypothetical protein